jgi:hypothetical protein
MFVCLQDMGGESEDAHYRLMHAHGALMIAAVIALFPTGILLARHRCDIQLLTAAQLLTHPAGMCVITARDQQLHDTISAPSSPVGYQYTPRVCTAPLLATTVCLDALCWVEHHQMSSSLNAHTAGGSCQLRKYWPWISGIGCMLDHR